VAKGLRRGKQSSQEQTKMAAYAGREMEEGRRNQEVAGRAAI